jgi:hypothetical protein
MAIVFAKERLNNARDHRAGRPAARWTARVRKIVAAVRGLAIPSAAASPLRSTAFVAFDTNMWDN